MIVTENTLTLGSINLEVQNQTETDESTVVKYLSRIISEVDLCLLYGFVWRPRLTSGLFLDELNSNETEYKPETVTAEVSKPSELDGVFSTHEGCPFRCHVTPKQPGLSEFLLTTVKMNYSEAVNDLNDVCLMLQCLQRKFQNIVLIGDFGHVCQRNFASEEYNWLHSEQFIWFPDNQMNASDTSDTTVHNQIVCFGDLLKEAFQKEQSTTVDISKLLNISPTEVLPITLHPPVRIELKWRVSIDSIPTDISKLESGESTEADKRMSRQSSRPSLVSERIRKVSATVLNKIKVRTNSLKKYIMWADVEDTDGKSPFILIECEYFLDGHLDHLSRAKHRNSNLHFFGTKAGLENPSPRSCSIICCIFFYTTDVFCNS
ncbi:hypothetical protein P879_04206 [Paragonimus westermani]|uniref:Uncharacterized protein n=1 Tax=Paragonimus westermani TaxID=34504 RepID=A0A8T0DI72_9TREM|nr:hypothetical protein P879_04206 [Paragonimus westermani]